MTAEPIAEPTPEPADESGVRWPVPPPEGYRVEDLFTLPDLPPHTELIDGSLVFVSRRPSFTSAPLTISSGSSSLWHQRNSTSFVGSPSTSTARTGQSRTWSWCAGAW